MNFTISCSQGRVAQSHDKREYTPKNADPVLKHKNKTIITTENYDEAFRELFKNSVEEYNSTQKRADRRKKDYLAEIKNGDGKEHPFYEYVLQIGRHETNGTLDESPEAVAAREALDATAKKLQTKYPCFKFWFIGSHGDEPKGTYHYHVCFTPVGTGYKNGMKTRCSLNKALENMGFKSNGKPYPIDLWKQDVEKTIEEEMKQRGLGREYKNEHRKRLDISDYRREQMVKDTEEKRIETITMYKNLKLRKKALDDREQDLNKKEQDLSFQKQKFEYEANFALEDLIKKQEEDYKNLRKNLIDFVNSRVKDLSKREAVKETITAESSKIQQLLDEQRKKKLAEFKRTLATLPDTEDSTDRDYSL